MEDNGVTPLFLSTPPFLHRLSPPLPSVLYLPCYHRRYRPLATTPVPAPNTTAPPPPPPPPPTPEINSEAPLIIPRHRGGRINPPPYLALLLRCNVSIMPLRTIRKSQDDLSIITPPPPVRQDSDGNKDAEEQSEKKIHWNPIRILSSDNLPVSHTDHPPHPHPFPSYQ